MLSSGIWAQISCVFLSLQLECHTWNLEPRSVSSAAVKWAGLGEAAEPGESQCVWLVGSIRGLSWRRQTTSVSDTPQVPTHMSTHSALSTAPQQRKWRTVVYARAWADIETMWRSRYLIARASLHPWSGGRRWLRSCMRRSTWFWPRWWSQWCTRESQRKRTPHHCRISSLTMWTEWSGLSRWPRWMGCCWWGFGPCNGSSIDTGKEENNTAIPF